MFIFAQYCCNQQDEDSSIAVFYFILLALFNTNNAQKLSGIFQDTQISISQQKVIQSTATDENRMHKDKSN